MQFSVKTDKGSVRKENQDAYLASNSQRLFIVADGMGGHSNGAEMSVRVCQYVKEYVSKYKEIDRSKTLFNAINYAHNKLINELSGGTTIVALWIRKENKAIVCHCGDSRAYLIRNNVITRLTKDHNAWEQFESRLPPRELAGVDEKIKRVAKSTLEHFIGRVGQESRILVESLKIELRKNDRIFLCSDGVVEKLSDLELRDMISGVNTDYSVNNIISKCLQRKCSDNVTCCLVEF